MEKSDEDANRSTPHKKGTPMTRPDERARALRWAGEFLREASGVSQKSVGSRRRRS